MDERISFNDSQAGSSAPTVPQPQSEPQLQPQSVPQPVYEPQGVPAEVPSVKNGRSYGIISIVCAVVSILFFPILFGPIGIVLGSTALKRGEKTLGLVGVILSSVFMVIGMIIGAALAYMQEKGMLGGALLFMF